MRTTIIILSVFFLINSCIEDKIEKDNTKPPTVITLPITDITWQYAISGGRVIDDGGSPVTSRGVCATEIEYDPPSLDSPFETWHTSDSSGLGSFTTQVAAHWSGAAKNLRSTTYIRAYATNKAGTAYGEVFSFLPKNKPCLSSDDVAVRLKSVKAKIKSATVYYFLYPYSLYHIDEMGICFGTSANPTIAGNYAVINNSDSMSISNLIPDNKYYIRGYVRNESGITYGEEISFTTYPNIPSSDAIKIESVIVDSIYVKVIYSTESEPDYTIDKIGIFYAKNTNPPSEENFVLASLTNGGLDSVTIENLTPNTEYYVRGYVENEAATFYSDFTLIKTLELIEGTVTDIDGNIYEYKTIGSQIWMRSNLNTMKYDDGTSIPDVQDNIEWNSTNTGAFCTYTGYGKLYNYFAIANSSKICPAGWHVPSDYEWKTLEMYLGMNQDQADAVGLRGTDEGGKLKDTLSTWTYPNVGATNSSGFFATGSGYRYDTGILTGERTSAYYWTISEYDISTAWCRSLFNSHAQIGRRNIDKKFGFSVRCIKD